MSAGIISAPVGGSSYVGLKPNSSKLFPVKDSVAWTRKTVANGSKTHCMETWNPIDNKKFETLSYLQPLSDESIAKEIEYMLKKGWVPCLEFDPVRTATKRQMHIPYKCFFP
ncbi:ribulose bisphosphate carboxylase small chain, chloroplastic-like [Camellia sinensis]|uniref:ribulose bisphosphate carboxylase small chain, chloroplastic-like n=1 Tax=Camellia sinensis TaxID=4442 RepID=UPI00103650A5|nr:ribulose bisphosphate carboxylase small chain, chloroplastic-like [Camellia sinensis]